MHLVSIQTTWFDTTKAVRPALAPLPFKCHIFARQRMYREGISDQTFGIVNLFDWKPVYISFVWEIEILLHKFLMWDWKFVVIDRPVLVDQEKQVLEPVKGRHDNFFYSFRSMFARTQHCLLIPALGFYIVSDALDPLLQQFYYLSLWLLNQLLFTSASKRGRVRYHSRENQFSA